MRSMSKVNRGFNKAALFMSLAMIVAPLAAQAETLSEALAAAYENNPVLLAERAALRAVDENVARANSGYRPTVAGDASISRSTIDSTTRADILGPDGVSANFDSTNKEYRAQIDQPLFRGLRTMNEVREAKAAVMAARERLRSVEQTVLLDAVTAYADVVRDEAVLALNDNQVEVLRRQLEASEDRFRVGEITRTDVAQSEARLAFAISNRIAAEAALTASREAYRRVIGAAPGSLQPLPELPPLPENLDAAQAAALDNNPILNGARFEESAAGHAVSSAKGTLAPQVSGFARIARTVGTNLVSTDVTGTRTTTVKSIGAQVSVPLYQAGAEHANVRQAKEIRSQRMLEIAVAERQVIESVRNAWEQLRTSRARIESDNASVRANEIALDGVRQEAAVGSRTTLDVLDAEQELLDSRVNLASSQRNEYVAAYSLLQAIGQAGARDLRLPVANYYDPAVHYQDVKWKLFGFGSDQ